MHDNRATRRLAGCEMNIQLYRKTHRRVPGTFPGIASRDDRPCKAIEGEFASSFSVAICTGANNCAENAKRATAR